MDVPSGMAPTIAMAGAFGADLALRRDKEMLANTVQDFQHDEPPLTPHEDCTRSGVLLGGQA